MTTDVHADVWCCITLVTHQTSAVLTGMRMLQTAYIDSNNITSTLPTELGLLLSILVEFNAYQNWLTAAPCPRNWAYATPPSKKWLRIVPRSTAKCRALQELHVEDDLLSGNIPVSVCGITSLAPGTIGVDCNATDTHVWPAVISLRR
jgi:hypothetical protein